MRGEEIAASREACRSALAEFALLEGEAEAARAQRGGLAAEVARARSEEAALREEAAAWRLEGTEQARSARARARTSVMCGISPPPFLKSSSLQT